MARKRLPPPDRSSEARKARARLRPWPDPAGEGESDFDAAAPDGRKRRPRRCSRFCRPVCRRAAGPRGPDSRPQSGGSGFGAFDRIQGRQQRAFNRSRGLQAYSPPQSRERGVEIGGGGAARDETATFEHLARPGQTDLPGFGQNTVTIFETDDGGAEIRVRQDFVRQGVGSRGIRDLRGGRVPAQNGGLAGAQGRLKSGNRRKLQSLPLLESQGRLRGVESGSAQEVLDRGNRGRA